jgi:hypothetical protein
LLVRRSQIARGLILLLSDLSFSVLRTRQRCRP